VGSEEGLKLLGDIGFGVAAFSANAFVVIYASMAPWLRSPFGRHLFFFMLTIALVFDSALINVIWPEFPFRTEIRAFLYCALGLAMLWRLIILLDVQVVQPWNQRRKDNENA
jgi:hypothetical protein